MRLDRSNEVFRQPGPEHVQFIFSVSCETREEASITSCITKRVAATGSRHRTTWTVGILRGLIIEQMHSKCNRPARPEPSAMLCDADKSRGPQRRHMQSRSDPYMANTCYILVASPGRPCRTLIQGIEHLSDFDVSFALRIQCFKP